MADCVGRLTRDNRIRCGGAVVTKTKELNVSIARCDNLLVRRRLYLEGGKMRDKLYCGDNFKSALRRVTKGISAVVTGTPTPVRGTTGTVLDEILPGSGGKGPRMETNKYDQYKKAQAFATGGGGLNETSGLGGCG